MSRQRFNGPDDGSDATLEIGAPADPPSDDSPAPGPASPQADDELALLKRDLDDTRDRLLRKTAEFDNYRKRIERERRSREAEAAAGVLSDLLPVLDDFERALAAAAEPEVEAYRAGLTIIHRQLLDLLRRWGVSPLEAVGRDFDPHYHQAIEHVASPGHRDGEVIEEVRRGYLLGDRLLRPAFVRVAKA